MTRYNDSTRISRCDFSQKCAENKGIQVRTKRDKCVSATKNKKVRTNDNNNNNKQEYEVVVATSAMICKKSRVLWMAVVSQSSVK